MLASERKRDRIDYSLPIEESNYATVTRQCDNIAASKGFSNLIKGINIEKAKQHLANFEKSAEYEKAACNAIFVPGAINTQETIKTQEIFLVVRQKNNKEEPFRIIKYALNKYQDEKNQYEISFTDERQETFKLSDFVQERPDMKIATIKGMPEIRIFFGDLPPLKVQNKDELIESRPPISAKKPFELAVYIVNATGNQDSHLYEPFVKSITGYKGDVPKDFWQLTDRSHSVFGNTKKKHRNMREVIFKNYVINCELQPMHVLEENSVFLLTYDATDKNCHEKIANEIRAIQNKVKNPVFYVIGLKDSSIKKNKMPKALKNFVKKKSKDDTNITLLEVLPAEEQSTITGIRFSLNKINGILNELAEHAQPPATLADGANDNTPSAHPEAGIGVDKQQLVPPPSQANPGEKEVTSSRVTAGANRDMPQPFSVPAGEKEKTPFPFDVDPSKKPLQLPQAPIKRKKGKEKSHKSEDLATTTEIVLLDLDIDEELILSSIKDLQHYDQIILFTSKGKVEDIKRFESLRARLNESGVNVNNSYIELFIDDAVASPQEYIARYLQHDNPKSLYVTMIINNLPEGMRATNDSHKPLTIIDIGSPTKERKKAQKGSSSGEKEALSKKEDYLAELQRRRLTAYVRQIADTCLIDAEATEDVDVKNDVIPIPEKLVRMGLISAEQKKLEKSVTSICRDLGKETITLQIQAKLQASIQQTREQITKVENFANGLKEHYLKPIEACQRDLAMYVADLVYGRTDCMRFWGTSAADKVAAIRRCALLFSRYKTNWVDEIEPSAALQGLKYDLEHKQKESAVGNSNSKEDFSILNKNHKEVVKFIDVLLQQKGLTLDKALDAFLCIVELGELYDKYDKYLDQYLFDAVDDYDRNPNNPESIVNKFNEGINITDDIDKDFSAKNSDNDIKSLHSVLSKHKNNNINFESKRSLHISQRYETILCRYLQEPINSSCIAKTLRSIFCCLN